MYRKIGLEWQNGNNTEIIGISQTGNVFQYNSELSPAPSRAVSLPDPEWDVICNNGGMKRWESSKGGILGLHPEKKNQVFGNAECKCNEGWVRSIDLIIFVLKTQTENTHTGRTYLQRMLYGCWMRGKSCR